MIETIQGTDDDFAGGGIFVLDWVGIFWLFISSIFLYLIINKQAMQRNKENGKQSYSDWYINKNGLFFVFYYSYYPKNKSDNTRKEYNWNSHVPPVIIIREYAKHIDQDNGDSDYYQKKGI